MSVGFLLSRVGVVYRALQAMVRAAIGAAFWAFSDAQRVDCASPTDVTGCCVASSEGLQARGRLADSIFKVNGHDRSGWNVLRPMGAILGEQFKGNHDFSLAVSVCMGIGKVPYYGYNGGLT